jgi:hypothetical protein
MTVNNLAVLERDEGNLKRSALLFKRALGSFVRTLGDRHPHAVLARGNRRAIEHELAERAARGGGRQRGSRRTPAGPAVRLKKGGRTRR